MSESALVVCGTCKVPPDIVSNADGKDEAVCPSCGQRDDVEDAQRIAGEFGADAIARGFQSGLGDIFKGKSGMKFTPERIPHRTFRWHLAAHG